MNPRWVTAKSLGRDWSAVSSLPRAPESPDGHLRLGRVVLYSETTLFAVGVGFQAMRSEGMCDAGGERRFKIKVRKLR